MTLDRPYYYTDDQFVMSDQVDMPNAFDYVVSARLHEARGLMAGVFLSQQRTLGGGDIRRQDMPFVSNRMNFSKVGGMVMYADSEARAAWRFRFALRLHVRRPQRRAGHHAHRRDCSVQVPREGQLDENATSDSAAWLVVAVTDRLTPREPGCRAAGTDAGAGNWQMIVLTGPTQIAVAAAGAGHRPRLSGGADGDQERAGAAHAAQRKAIDYWSRGGVLRWNEILLELVSRFNLPPAPAADGTYPVPDANNPFADPQFPFGNPPYAARAYSYVAVAQFDALKAAWYYKYPLQPALALEGRQQHPGADAGHRSAGLSVRGCGAVGRHGRDAEAALPGGGGGDHAQGGRAAAGGAAVGEGDGQRHRRGPGAGPGGGRGVRRARRHRRHANRRRHRRRCGRRWRTPPSARGEIPWKSMDIPARPPMLPLFGNVRAWMMTPADIVNERPGPPPSTSSALMAREVAEVKARSIAATREELAIANKWADGPSTPTPPGHWNFIAAPYIRQAEFSEVRAARAFALLNMALHDAAVGCWDAKYLYFNPRPSQLDPDLKIGHRPAELPVVHLRPLDVLGGGGRSAVLPVPERRGGLRGAEKRSLDVAAVRRHPLPVGHRSGQGPRQADRRLHGQLRAPRRR